MSLKDWMKKVETAQLNEMTQTVMVPGAKPGDQPTALAIDDTKQGGKVVAAALGARPGSGITVMTPNSPVRTVPPNVQQPQQPQQSQSTQTVGGTTQVSETGLDQVHSLYDEIKVPQAKTGSSLDYIKENHPHECKMFEEGWGLDESLYGALVDHYFKEGRIPRGVILEGGQALREFVESCYAQDTGMGGNQAAINNGMLDEDEYDTENLANEVYSAFESMYPNLARRADERTVHAAIMDVLNYGGDNDPSALASDVARAVKSQMSQSAMSEGSKEDFTMNARQADPRLDKYATDPKKSFLDKASAALTKAGSAVMNKLHPSDEELRRGPLGETKEKEMHQSNKSKKVAESGYSDKNPKLDIYVDGKYVASTNWAKTSAEAKTGWLSKHPADADKKITIQKSKKAVSEAVTKNDKGLKHTADAGGYGRKHDGDEKPAKGAKKDSEDTGSKFDSSELTKTIGGKKPEKEVGKLSVKKRVKIKADREEKKKSVKEAIELGDNELGMPMWYIVDTNDQVVGGPFDSQDEARVSFKTSIWARSRWPDGRSEYDIAYGIEDDDGNFHEDERGIQESKKLKGDQVDLDVNKNGEVDSGDLAMLRNQKKNKKKDTQKDTQMESWEAQLKNLLTEDTAAPTNTDQGADKKSVSITSEDASKLLQILQNAGLSVGTENSPVMSPSAAPAQVSTTATSPATGPSGGSADNADLGGSGSAVATMPMPRGMAFSVQPAETDIPTAPPEVSVSDSEDVFNQLGKDHAQSEKSDNGDAALTLLKKSIGHSAEYVDDKQSPTAEGTSDKSKKPEEEKVDEGKETCNECGGLMEDEHECDSQLNEWSNSPQGQSGDEKFEAELEFMQNIISGGLNKKKEDQTVMPHTKVKVTESKVNGTSDAYTLELKKLAGI